LTANKKFEVDEKLGLPELTRLIETVCDGNIDSEKLLLTKMEESQQGVFSFKDDAENPLFKKMVEKIKELKKQGKK
jgi:hypothetical protein